MSTSVVEILQNEGVVVRDSRKEVGFCWIFSFIRSILWNIFQCGGDEGAGSRREVVLSYIFVIFYMSKKLAVNFLYLKEGGGNPTG
jgi:hypothetical protein